MVLHVLLAALIGSSISVYGVFMVEYIYRFKGTSKASFARALGIASICGVATFGNILTHKFLPDTGDEGLYVAIAFTLSIIICGAAGLYIRRHNIG
jgi:LPXTG-motif cell wall-anchored protein